MKKFLVLLVILLFSFSCSAQLSLQTGIYNSKPTLGAEYLHQLIDKWDYHFGIELFDGVYDAYGMLHYNFGELFGLKTSYDVGGDVFPDASPIAFTGLTIFGIFNPDTFTEIDIASDLSGHLLIGQNNIFGFKNWYAEIGAGPGAIAHIGYTF